MEKKRIVKPGNRYGKLVALEPVDNESWLCHCDCGNEKVVKTIRLLNGTRSCGCLRRRGHKEIKPGMVFQNLTVLEPVDDRTWLCRCTCGKEKAIPREKLIYHAVKSCGCLRGRKEKLVIEPGMRYGKLTVIRKGERINRNLTWICRCDCGKEKAVYQSNLQNGKTHSCGCSQHVRPARKKPVPVKPGTRFGTKADAAAK